MKITITIESDRPFNGNEVTQEEYEQWLWSRRNQRYQEKLEHEGAQPDWLVRMQELATYAS